MGNDGDVADIHDVFLVRAERCALIGTERAERNPTLILKSNVEIKRLNATFCAGAQRGRKSLQE
jgi:hypothetical protein